MFVEVVYGLLSNSLGLLTDGAHMLLDCSAILIGLYSRYLSKKSKNEVYNFGYERAEVLGTFINSVFLIFISLYIVFESFERSIQPKDIHGENLILVSFLGLIVNLIGIYFFHNDHGSHSHSHSGCSHVKENKNKHKSKHSNCDKNYEHKNSNYHSHDKIDDISREGSLKAFDSEIYASSDSKYFNFLIKYVNLNLFS